MTQHVSVGLSMYLKNRPEGYRGLRNENWSFGKEKPAKLHEMIRGMATVLADFYMGTGVITPLETAGEIELCAQQLSELAAKFRAAVESEATK